MIRQQEQSAAAPGAARAKRRAELEQSTRELDQQVQDLQTNRALR